MKSRIKLEKMQERDIISVGELTNKIKAQLEDNIGFVKVKGEISNFKQHSSGHRYFSLKDENAQISCTMWRSRTLNFLPEDGMKVIISGRITVYPPRGNYQIDVSSMQPVGQGDLFLAFEALKKKLEEKGYFDPDYKKPIPALPMKIGVATSPTGAAVRDILSTLERRFPAAEVFFRPAIVQGDGSAEDIVEAIRELHQTDAEVLIIGRGGGSLEDLWAFNMEIVAEEIFNSKLPIISAVGHETDFTIADFVADVRAATPTAAAELVTPRTSEEITKNIIAVEDFMTRLMTDEIENLNLRLDGLKPEKMSLRILDKISMNNQLVDELESRSVNLVKNNLQLMDQKIGSLETLLKSLQPLQPLKKGFALLRSDGKILGSEDSLKDHKNIEIEREQENAKAKVTEILPKNLFD